MFKKSLILVLLVGLVVGCGTSNPVATPTPVSPSPGLPTAAWPTDGWQTATPEAQGIDSETLADMLEIIQSEALGIHSALLIRNGYLVMEAYFHPYAQGTRHLLFSVTKSFTSALVGIAVELGLIEGVDAPALSFFPDRTVSNLDEAKRALTLEDLLTMTAGLAWREDALEIPQMLQQEDWVQYVLDLPMEHEPGEQFNYCSGCSHLLSAIVQKSSGTDTLTFAGDRLFGPLGIRDYKWMTDPQGIAGGGWGLEMRPRDMAKLGYLYLKDGAWEQKQVVPADWVRASLTRQVETEPDVDYGYQWWLYPEVNAFAAQGFGAQMVVAFPRLELITVFTAALFDSDPLWQLIEGYIIPAVQADAPLPDNREGVARLQGLIEQVAQP
jgi:CubicO group peptidase (beta-lactamase class C family)